MANRFATLVVVMIITLLVFFAFQSFYKPSTLQNGVVKQENKAVTSSNPSRIFFISLASSSVFTVPETNVSYRHNVSIANGTRFDHFTFQGSPADGSQSLSLLVFVSKKLARDASKVSASHSPQIVQRDPIFYYPTLLVGALPVERGILIPLPLDLSEQELGGANVIGIPLRQRLTDSQVEIVLQAFNAYGDVFQNLNSADEALEVDARISAILNQVKQFENRYVDLGRYLDSLRNGGGQVALPEAQFIPELREKINELTPKAAVSFEVCRLPDCSRATQRFYDRPLVRVEGRAGDFANIYYSDSPNPLKVKVTVAIDASKVPLRAGKLDLRSYNGQTLSSIQGRVVVSYPEYFGAELSATLQVEVVHVPDLIRLHTTRIRGGQGGELVFINSIMPNAITEFGGCGLASQVSLPGVGSNGLKVFYVPPSFKNLLPPEGCEFSQGGGALGLKLAKAGQPWPAGQFNQLYPVVASAESWETCTRNYCTCEAASEALGFAVEKVRQDATAFYGVGYTTSLLTDRQRPFSEVFPFMLTNFDETCSFGGVQFDSRPQPGKIQAISIRLDPQNPQDVRAWASTTPDTFFADSMIALQPGDALPTREQISQTLSQPWLCHDSTGLPSPQPNAECSRELRSPPFTTVAGR